MSRPLSNECTVIQSDVLTLCQSTSTIAWQRTTPLPWTDTTRTWRLRLTARTPTATATTQDIRTRRTNSFRTTTTADNRDKADKATADWSTISDTTRSRVCMCVGVCVGGGVMKPVIDSRSRTDRITVRVRATASMF